MSESNTKKSIDKFDLRRAFGSFATGVTIVTTMDAQGQPCGFTANSFSSVSLEPPLVLVSIAKTAFGLATFADCKGFAINILAEHQRDLSNRFASKGTDKFSGVDWQPGSTGAPLLNEVVAWFDCENFQQIDAGDHVILIGKVLDYSYSTDAPLGFCRGAYVSFGLSPKMLELVTSMGRLQVGALIESDGQLLLQIDPKSGVVKIPVANRVGDEHDSASLLGKLAAANINVTLPFLFAAYNCDDTRSIYYRGEAHSIGKVAQAPELQFFEYDSIPWKRVQNLADLSMIRRFFREREVDDFGVYIGDYEEGDVYPLPSGD